MKKFNYHSIKDTKEASKLSSANSINIARLIPQIFYYAYSYLQLKNKKIPVLKLSITSAILLLIVLGFLRFYGGFDPNTKYSPATYEDGELKPAENK